LFYGFCCDFYTCGIVGGSEIFAPEIFTVAVQINALLLKSFDEG